MAKVKNGKNIGDEHKSSNIYDVFIAIFNGFFNLFRFEKIVSIVILYILFRDAYFSLKAESYEQIKNLLIGSDLIEKLLLNDNATITVLTALVFVLIAVIILLICIIRFVYKKEIDRLADERNGLLQGIPQGEFVPLKEHYTTKEKI